MIRAYNEIYVDDAMHTLAEVFNYAKGGRQVDMLAEDFVMSGVASQFERGNPHYINMPSHALYFEITQKPSTSRRCGFEKSPEYWCGFVLAYYQWYTGLKFEQIFKRLHASDILKMYHPLHEASLRKFVDVANNIVLQEDTNLARIRKTANLSQKKLAEYSNVSLRSIQLYEQRRLDINTAAAYKLLHISKVLGCYIEDLLEPENIENKKEKRHECTNK